MVVGSLCGKFIMTLQVQANPVDCVGTPLQVGDMVVYSKDGYISGCEGLNVLHMGIINQIVFSSSSLVLHLKPVTLHTKDREILVRNGSNVHLAVVRKGSD